MDNVETAEKRGGAKGRYFVKCDECRETMRFTDSVRESAEGGRCAKCRAEADAAYLRRQSPHTCDPVKVAAAIAAIWGAK